VGYILTHIILPPLPTIHIWLVGGLHEPLLMYFGCKDTNKKNKTKHKKGKKNIQARHRGSAAARHLVFDFFCTMRHNSLI
jgi:hypothetical protein